MKTYRLAAFAVAAVVCGCTSVNVRPVASTVQLHDVRIVSNPRVIVSDFVPVMRDGFSRHNIATTVVDESGSRGCPVMLTYTANLHWDLMPYLTHAELRLWEGGKQIGFAQYHLNGGFDVGKWRGTKAKMDPVIDQLLASQSGG